MENKTNERVPMAILSCFLIAFILQGTLKMAGVFVFDKALTWDIFRIIDNNKLFYILNYFIITSIIVYCLSFSFTSKWYSNKWYHYLIMLIPTLIVIIIKTKILMPLKLQFLTDILLYIGIPLIIYFTTNKKYRLFEQSNIYNVVTIISLQILLYFCYLGLGYWSGLLNSLVPVLQNHLPSSTMFLIFFERYLAQICMMLSCNFMIRKFKNKEV